jgi:hypothetical protein
MSICAEHSGHFSTGVVVNPEASAPMAGLQQSRLAHQWLKSAEFATQ